MTRDEKFMAACRAFLDAERAVAACRIAAYGISPAETQYDIAWRELAAARRDRHRARRRMMYHYAKLA